AYASQARYDMEGTPGKPTKVSRWLGGVAQTWQNDYNAAGNPANTTDPVGRKTTRCYASNLIDVLSIRQSTGYGGDPCGSPGAPILWQATYTNHQPVSVTDASGKTTTYTYLTGGRLRT